MIGVRISVFGISYFTIGPQVGGEPLQVIYLQRKYGLTYTRATSTVVMDKLLELLANFILLVFGLRNFSSGDFSRNGNPPILSLIVLFAFVSWPLIYIILLYKKNYPLSEYDAIHIIHSTHKSDLIYSSIGTFSRTILSATCARIICGDFGFIICRDRNGKRILFDNVFSPNPFGILADGSGVDRGLALVSRASARGDWACSKRAKFSRWASLESPPRRPSVLHL